MAQRGNQPQPIALIEAKGKKHLTKKEIEERREREIKVEFVENIHPPDYLPSPYHDEFYEISGKLKKIGIMTDLDVDVLAQYLIAKSNYVSYTAMLLKSIMTSSKKKVLVSEDLDSMAKIQSLQDKAFNQCRKSAGELGLSISSRCRLVMPEVREVSKPENKFAKFAK